MLPYPRIITIAASTRPSPVRGAMSPPPPVLIAHTRGEAGGEAMDVRTGAVDSRALPAISTPSTFT